jgi:protein ImuB
VACVSLPAFPLQLVLRAHPDWREDPVVVVEGDRPSARILWSNRPARALRIRPGTRFAQAQSLAARLHAAVVEEAEQAEAVDHVFRRLLLDCPAVEPAEECPGLFWLDPNGLGALYGSPMSWASRVHAALGENGWVPAVVVGWQRHFVFAVSRARPGVRVFARLESERHAAESVPLARLDLPPALKDPLRKLGVRTVGQLLALPVDGLRVRWGSDAAAAHDLLSGKAWRPFRPRLPAEPFRARIPVEPPDDDPARLLFGLKNALHDLVAKLERQSRGIVAAVLTFSLDHAPPHRERIETAGPTLDVLRLLDLVRLRLSAVTLAAPVEEIDLRLESRRVHPAQIELLKSQPKRDPVAAANALARVQAMLGPGSVVRAVPADAHRPERRFRWEPFGKLRLPRPAGPEEHVEPVAAEPPPLVRSFLAAPAPLPDLPAHEKEAWLGRHGAVMRLLGPDRVAGGWWEDPAERDYFFAETRTGEILWIYRDRRAGRWFLHGVVD